MKKNLGKRILSLVLTLTMIVTLIPSSLIMVEAEETPLAAAIFASDIHETSTSLTGSGTSAMKSVLSKIGSNGVTYNTIGFVGDTYSDIAGKEADMTSAAQTALGQSAGVYYAYGDHDEESDISPDSGLLYTGDYYYIYHISDANMRSEAGATSTNSESAISAFETAAASMDKSRVLFIMSHVPLHDRRDDNTYANAWYTAIKDVADTMEVVFLWAHNHTEESDVDRAAYYVARDGDETITIYGGDTVTPNFTYMNAGYIYAAGQKPSRLGVATTVEIYADTLVFQDYNSSGTYTDETYSHNVTVTREFKDTVDSGTTVTKTLTGIAVTTQPNKTTYNVGDTFSADGLVVTATYSDNSTAAVTDYTLSSVDMTAAGTQTVTVTYTEGSITQTATFDIVVSQSTDEVTDAWVTIGTNEEDTQTATLDGEVTSTTKKTVYVLTNSISSGNSYLIANVNAAGSGYVVKNNSGSIAATEVTVKTDSSIGTYIELDDATNELWTVNGSYTFENQDKYLRCSNGSLSVSDTSTTWSYSSNRLSYTSSGMSPKAPGDNQQSKTYYLRYNNGWTVTEQSNSASSIYFYVPTEVEVTTSTTAKVKYSVSASDIMHVYSADNKTAVINASVLANDEVTTLGGTYSFAVVSDEKGIIDTETTTGSTIHFTGVVGEAKVRVYYTFTKDNKEYTIWTTINVITLLPDSYSIEITHDDDNSSETADIIVTDTIVLKGIKADQTYDLNSLLTLYSGDSSSAVINPTNVTWTSSDENVATVDKSGTVKLTGKDGTFDITVYYTFVNSDGETVSVTDVVTFSVTEKLYTIPSDGTNDFPEYPNQGAIRFDKTAEAQGNFSETGIAKVELSMTGVPYSKGSAIDVLLMIDMSTSMDTTVDDNDTTNDSSDDLDRVDVTIDAAKAFAKSIVQNKDGSYNTNKIAIKYFNGDDIYTTTDYITVSSDDELTALNTLIEGLYTPTESGTYYSVAMEEAYNTLIAQDAISDNTQALVFMSDGGPTYYTYLNDSGTGTTVGGDQGATFVSWFTTDDNDTSDDETDDTATPNSSFKTEYYSYLLKQKGYPVYTVGLGLSSNDTGPSSYTGLTSGAHEAITSYILSQMATNNSYFYNVADSDAVDNLGNIFSAIALSILEAATNVVVEDMIADEYTMNFKLPNTEVTAEEAGMSEFYIQVVDYVLDATTHERTGVYTVIENFTFNTDGTLKSHTVDGEACGDSCSHVTFTDGVVTKIDGTYFDYYIKNDGSEMLEWNAEKLSSTELALQYFVYLDNSAGFDAKDQVDADTYPTNEYATITYTNFNGNECQQYFPIPSLTWKGAQVTYVFYLVNENGEPVNRAGKVVPFAEATYVTNPVTYDVTWNEDAGIEKLNAKYLAEDLVPDVYDLYDSEAYYEVLVYQTEGVDSATSAVNYNHFIIEGSSSVTNKETTKVFNTKSGTRYDDYGAYSATAGTYTSTKSKTEYTATVTTDIDYANTTVAFAVVWKPELVADTVVIDYGLDVVIDVYANDGLAAGVTGVSLTKPYQTIADDIEINKGTYGDAYKVGSSSITGDNGLWTAIVENLTSVRFHLNNMQMKNAVTFYYEAGVNYYTYTTSGETTTATLNTTNMYSSVTVIPATTIYYEDDFLSYSAVGTEWTDVKDEDFVADDTQDTDRPGDKFISEEYDANNVYGYDSAYTECSKYSLGTAKKVTVDSDSYAKAAFSFWGTGFDIISLTSNTTGTIVVKVYNYDDKDSADKKAVKSLGVDTYYGYLYGVLTDDEGNELLDDNNEPVYGWYVDETATNALYQIPVIQIEELTYGHYYAEITATYISALDHTSAEGYDLYLDAIRIYDPAGISASSTLTDEQEIIKDAYVADGEYSPEYTELRDLILSKTEFDTLSESESSKIGGVVFIDGIAENKTVEDYDSYGPNNEVYLAKGQSVVFKLDLSSYGEKLADVQLGIKSANGNDVDYSIFNVDETNTTFEKINVVNKTVSTTTDMYYSIKDYIGNTIVITNNSDSILSLTNIKVTEKNVEESEDNGTTAASEVYVTPQMVSYSLRTLNYVAPTTFAPEVFEVTLEETVEVGTDVNVNVTTSTDVEYIYVNDTLVAIYTDDETTGLRTFTTSIPTTEVGTLEVNVVAYNGNDLVSETSCWAEVIVTEKTFTPETFKVSVLDTTVVGTTVTLTVTTSTDVEKLTVNGEEITTYRTNRFNGQRIWTMNVKASEVGEMTFDVVAYDVESTACTPITETVTVKTVQNIIKDIFDWIFG